MKNIVRLVTKLYLLTCCTIGVISIINEISVFIKTQQLTTTIIQNNILFVLIFILFFIFWVSIEKTAEHNRNNESYTYTKWRDDLYEIISEGTYRTLFILTYITSAEIFTNYKLGFIWCIMSVVAFVTSMEEKFNIIEKGVASIEKESNEKMDT